MFPHVILVGFLCLLLGCDVNGSASLAFPLSLRVPVAEPQPPSFRAMALDTHADYDRVESILKERMTAKEIVDLHATWREQRPDDFLLEVRALNHLFEVGNGETAHVLLPRLEALQKEHPEHPDVIYLQGRWSFAVSEIGELPWALFPADLGKGVFSLLPFGNREVREKMTPDSYGVLLELLVVAWSRLAADYPYYIGPGGIRAIDLGSRAAAIQEALNLEEPSAPEGSGMTVGESTFWQHVVKFHLARRDGDPSGACSHGRRAISTLLVGEQVKVAAGESALVDAEEIGAIPTSPEKANIKAFRTLYFETCGEN